MRQLEPVGGLGIRQLSTIKADNFEKQQRQTINTDNMETEYRQTRPQTDKT